MTEWGHPQNSSGLSIGHWQDVTCLNLSHFPTVIIDLQSSSEVDVATGMGNMELQESASEEVRCRGTVAVID